MSQSTESDVFRAQHAIRTHCPIDWPNGRRCLNCNVRFPCPSLVWGYEVLRSAGWPEDEILNLDTRTGPWA